MTVIGRLEPFFETGTEGVIWSLSDPSLPAYDGLWPLRGGDRLRVVDGERWEGVVDLEYARNRQPSPYGGIGGQVASGMWVHGFQADMEPDAWANMFFERYRATVTPSEHREPHPFHGSSEGMEERLRTLNEKRAHELFRTAIGPWLMFYDNGWMSLARKWEFSLDETIQLIGATPEQSEQWKIYPKRQSDCLMPFDWTIFIRLALLYGVYGGLDWKFSSDSERGAWLRDKKASLLDTDTLMGVRDMALVGWGEG